MEVTDFLLHSPNSSGPIYVKLKRKLEYCDHVLFEPVGLVFLDRPLKFLKENNPSSPEARALDGSTF